MLQATLDPSFLLLLSSAIPLLSFHTEPSNALSLPTWVIHSSSLLEWTLALRLIWQHAERSGNKRWKGMSVAMLLSLFSGLCACTFHFFYNPTDMNWLVVSQAASTVVGNCAMALAAFRIFEFERNKIERFGGDKKIKPSPNITSFNSRSIFTLFTEAFAVACVVKYGSLLIDFPSNVETRDGFALAMTIIPVIITYLLLEFEYLMKEVQKGKNLYSE